VNNDIYIFDMCSFIFVAFFIFVRIVTLNCSS